MGCAITTTPAACPCRTWCPCQVVGADTFGPLRQRRSDSRGPTRYDMGSSVQHDPAFCGKTVLGRSCTCRSYGLSVGMLIIERCPHGVDRNGRGEAGQKDSQETNQDRK